MRLSRPAVITILALSACLVFAGLGSASVVAVDVASKAATSDVSTLEPTSTVSIQGHQISLMVRSKTLEPQLFYMRYTGLVSPSYDLYVNNEFKGSKSKDLLQKGVEIRVDGSVVDPGMIRCLNSIPPGLKVVCDRIKDAKDDETKSIHGILSEALERSKLTLNQEQNWRSVAVIINPAGIALEDSESYIRKSDYETASVVTNSCWQLQMAREAIYHQAKIVELRNDAVKALTPVEFSASCSVKNGKPHISVKLLNNCELPLSGTVSLGLPAGWKAPGAKLKFSQLKSGQTFSLSCDLVASAKSPAPKEVPVTADVTITQLDKTAKMKLSATAKAAAK